MGIGAKLRQLRTWLLADEQTIEPIARDNQTDGPYDLTIPHDGMSSTGAADAAAERNPRRNFVFGMGTLALGFAQACADSIMSGKSNKTNSRATDEETTEAAVPPEEGAVVEEEEPILPAGDCHPSKLSSLEVDAPEAPADLAPKVVFYGLKAKSSMIAYQFSTSRKIRAITLLSDTKNLLSYQIISQADIPEFEALPYAPMVVDNLFLDKCQHLIMLIRLDKSEEGEKLYQYKVDLNYLTEFAGDDSVSKPVVDYSLADEVDKFLAAGVNYGQSVATFKVLEEATTFIAHPTIKYPDDKGVADKRPLMLATRNSKWQNVAPADGKPLGISETAIVTDLMGNRLTVDETLILRHQTLITYVLSNDSEVFLRTMLKIG